MKRMNLLALTSLLFFSVVVGCSEPDAPAAGGAMMNDDTKMKDGGAMMQEAGGTMKDDTMMKDGAMMKEDGK
jgi:hypothetical protein